MCLIRIVLLPSLSCLVFLLMGAMARQPAVPPPPAPSYFVPQSTPSSLSAPNPLDDAIAFFSPERIRWIELAVAQKGLREGTSFQAESYCVLGPDNRMRCDMSVQLGKTVSRQRVVSNGRLLWVGKRVANSFPSGELLILPREQAQHRLQQERSLVNLQSLLVSVREHLGEPRYQSGSWKGRSSLLITGSWKTDKDKSAVGSLVAGAKRCNLYFDAATRMPFRIEWWNEGSMHTPPALVWEMEIRSLNVNQPLSPAAFARTFSFGTLYN